MTPPDTGGEKLLWATSYFSMSLDGVVESVTGLGEPGFWETAPSVDAGGLARVVLSYREAGWTKYRTVVKGVHGTDRVRWTLELTTDAASAGKGVGGALDNDGTYYLNTVQDLWAISETGEVKWKTTLGALDEYIEGRADVSIGPTGTIFVSSNKGTLLAFDKEGKQLWEWKYMGENSAHRISSPIVGADETVFLDVGGGVYCAVRNGQTLWEADSRTIGPGADFWVQPAIDAAGRLRFTASAGDIAIEAADGKVLWYRPILARGGREGAGVDGPSIDVKGNMLYLPGLLQWLDATGGGGILLEPIFVARPLLTVGGVLGADREGRIIEALTDGRTDVLAKAPWPAVHHDEYNTRNAGADWVW